MLASSKQMKALGLRPCAFICFSVFGTHDEALALVFDILRELLHFKIITSHLATAKTKVANSIKFTLQN